MEDKTVSKKVTFGDGLPRGAVATFKHDGELWFAYPQDKVQGLGVVMDRMIGTISGLHSGLVDWINAHPEDSARVAMLLGSVASTRELALAKAEAWVWKEERVDDEAVPEVRRDENG